MTGPRQPLAFDEAGVRAVLLVQAIEQADTGGRLLGRAERDRCEQEAARLARGQVSPEDAPPAAAYLAERARLILQSVEQRDARLAALRQPWPWSAALVAGLILGAALAGFVLERFASGGRVHVLAEPLLAILLWNFAVFTMLALAGLVALLPNKGLTGGLGATLQRWWARLPPLRGERAGLRGQVAARFRLLLWQTTARVQMWRARWVLHAASAGWALGVAAAVVVSGWARDPVVGWESLWLRKPEYAHAVIERVYAPAVAFFPFAPITLDEVRAMRFDRQQQAATDDGRARRWVLMMLALLLVAVVVPRGLLALHARWRQRHWARQLVVDAGQPWIVQALARVMPVRVVVAWTADDARARQWLLRVWQQAAPGQKQHGPPGRAWQLLASPRGDCLQVLELPSDGQTQGEGADLLLRVSAGAVQPDGDARAAAPGTASIGGASVPVVSVALAAAAPCTLRDEPLRQAIAQGLPAHLQAGLDRLFVPWRATAGQRHQDALQDLAQLLLRSAQQVEQVPARPWWKPGEREKARQAALAAVLQRVDADFGQVHERLWRQHGLDTAPARAAIGPAGGQGARATGGVQAGMWGAATGAAGGAAAGAIAGAKIDVLTGGLTLGIATALGGVLGAGAWIAANWDGRSEMRLSDEMMQTLAELALSRYLAVIHQQRLLPDPAVGVPAHWNSETVAQAALATTQLAAFWAQARQSGEGHAPSAASAAALAQCLDLLLQGLIGRLHGRPDGAGTEAGGAAE